MTATADPLPRRPRRPGRHRLVHRRASARSVVGDPYVMDDDRIGHAELDVAGAPLYLADEYPELGLTGPDDGRVSVSLHLAVPDVDAAVDRAATVGATVERPPTDAPTAAPA